jgi:hypothetical protein
MVKTTNLNASLKRIASDGKIHAPEMNRVTAAIIRDLGQQGDAKKIFEKIGKNMEAFVTKVRTEMGEPNPELKASEAALEKLEDLVEGMADAVDEWDDFQMGIFGAAMGIAFEDDHVSVRDVDALDDLARDLVKNAGADEKIGHKVRNTMAMLEMVLNGGTPMDDSDDDMVVSASARRKLDKLDRFLARQVAKEIGTQPSGGTVDPSSELGGLFESIASGSGGMAAGFGMIFLPTLVERDLAVFDSEGLSGQAKHKLDSQAEARGRVLLEHVNALPGDPDDKEALQTMLYRLVTGHYVPPDQKDEFVAHLDGATTDELKDALEGIDRQSDMWGALPGRTGKNMRAANAEARKLIEDELAQRNAGIPPAPAAPTGANAPGNVMGFDLPESLSRSVKEERNEVGEQLRLLADARAAGNVPNVPVFMEAYAKAIDALFYGGASEMFDAGDLKKASAESNAELLEVAMALDMARRAAAHGETAAEPWEARLNQLLVDTGRFGTGDVNSEDVYFTVMADFPV